MKRTLYIIATAVALVLTAGACSSDVFQKADKPTTPVVPGVVEIAISNMTDTSFDVTLTPTSESAYYSFLVDNDVFYPAIDAAKLYSSSYSSVTNGSVKYAEGSESYSFTVNAEPYTIYTVYAVCASIDGTVGEVSHATFQTSDGVAPEPSTDDFQTLDNKVLLSFSEDIKLVEGKVVTAQVYSLNDLSNIGEPQGQPLKRGKKIFKQKQIEVPDEPVIVEGEVQVKNNQVLVTFPDIKQPGAYYAVSFEDGTFEDLAGNPCPGVASEFAGCEWDDEEEAYVAIPGEVCVYGHIDNVPFEFNIEGLPEVITDLETPFEFVSEFEIFDYTEEGASAVIKSVSAEKTVTSEYTLDWEQTWGWTDANVITTYIPDEMTGGMTISFTIEADNFWDEWGNTNAAVTTPEILFSYGLTIDDLLGEYAMTANPLTQSAAEFKIVIAETEEEGYDFQITEFDGAKPLSPVLGTFDGDLGIVTIPALQPIALRYSQYYYCLQEYSSAGPVVFNITEPGVISTDQYVEGAAYSASTGSYAGYFDVWKGMSGIREEVGGGLEVESKPGKEFKAPMTAPLK
ncbi:MAG: hypothetical protein II465_00185 [Bacteroidales bacterium]|nr:hypothetical protein [Bacteroidales bacterium]